MTELQTRYQPLPLWARNRLTGEVCRVHYVTDGDGWTMEGDLVLEHLINGQETKWRLFSTKRYMPFDASDWELQTVDEHKEEV